MGSLAPHLRVPPRPRLLPGSATRRRSTPRSWTPTSSTSSSATLGDFERLAGPAGGVVTPRSASACSANWSRFRARQRPGGAVFRANPERAIGLAEDEAQAQAAMRAAEPSAPGCGARQRSSLEAARRPPWPTCQTEAPADAMLDFYNELLARRSAGGCPAPTRWRGSTTRSAISSECSCCRRPRTCSARRASRACRSCSRGRLRPGAPGSSTPLRRTRLPHSARSTRHARLP